MQVSQLLFLVLSTATLGACGSLREDVTSLECGETISLDFSGEVPLVNCSSACPGDMQTWSVGAVYKRSTALSPFRLMVKMKYSYSGVKCSLVESTSDEDLLAKYREESGICNSSPSTLHVSSTSGVITESTGNEVSYATKTSVNSPTYTPATGSSATISEITTGITGSETTTSSGVETVVSTISGTSSTEKETAPTTAAGTTSTGTASEKTEVSADSESDSGNNVVTKASSAFTEPATAPEATTITVEDRPTDEPEETTMQGCGKNGENNNDQKELVSTVEPTTTTTTAPTTSTTTTEPPTTTTTTTTAPAPVVVCPDGWSRFADSCYHISSERGSWDSGVKYCKDIGGSYVTITSSDEQRFVASLMNHSSWIGYNDRSKEGKFVWASGEASSYEAFGKGEPNGVSRPEDCVEMRKEVGYKWNDVSCSFRKYYACETGLVVQK